MITSYFEVYDVIIFLLRDVHLRSVKTSKISAKHFLKKSSIHPEKIPTRVSDESYTRLGAKLDASNSRATRVEQASPTRLTLYPFKTLILSAF